jgi:hypothetical protein
MIAENKLEGGAPNASWRGLLAKVGSVGSVVALGGLLWWSWRVPSAPSSASQHEEMSQAAERPSTPPVVLPDPLPPVAASAALDLSDDAEVIGVSAGGEYRAYVVRAFRGNPEHHIANDRIGGVPITVTYCDLFDCVEVVTGDAAGDRPLAVSLFGVDHNGMKLRVGDVVYHQSSLTPLVADSPSFPYRKYPWERMSWKKWKTAHPDTDVVLGWDDK